MVLRVSKDKLVVVITVCLLTLLVIYMVAVVYAGLVPIFYSHDYTYIMRVDWQRFTLIHIFGAATCAALIYIVLRNEEHFKAACPEDVNFILFYIPAAVAAVVALSYVTFSLGEQMHSLGSIIVAKYYIDYNFWSTLDRLTHLYNITSTCLNEAIGSISFSDIKPCIVDRLNVIFVTYYWVDGACLARLLVEKAKKFEEYGCYVTCMVKNLSRPFR